MSHDMCKHSRCFGAAPRPACDLLVIMRTLTFLRCLAARRLPGQGKPAAGTHARTREAVPQSTAYYCALGFPGKCRETLYCFLRVPSPNSRFVKTLPRRGAQKGGSEQGRAAGGDPVLRGTQPHSSPPSVSPAASAALRARPGVRSESAAGVRRCRRRRGVRAGRWRLASSECPRPWLVLRAGAGRLPKFTLGWEPLAWRPTPRPSGREAHLGAGRSAEREGAAWRRVPALLPTYS